MHFLTMKMFNLFIMCSFVLCNYGIKVAETRLDYQSDDLGSFLDGQTSGPETLLTTHTDDPDKHRDVSEIITSKGYPSEKHTVQTDDGYLLTLLRIPHGRNGSSKGEGKKVVLLLHGDLSDAIQWVLDFPNQSLGFLLPDKGYDTWLLNNRGSRYSREHVEYETNEYRFWNFSFSDMGQYDVPATIDYILEETNKDGLYIVAHSRGTSQTFAMLSEMPDYNDKVKLFIAMAPVTFLGSMTSAVRALVPVAEEAAVMINLATGGEFLTDNWIAKKIKTTLCAATTPDLCKMLLFAIGGADKAQLNETRLDVYTAHLPSSTSTKSLVHFAQLVKSKKFRRYDYGRSKNLKYYQQEEPPDYDLSSITTPVALFWSSSDRLVDPEDVAILRRQLKTVVFDYRVRYPYNHFDFAIAKNAPEFLYKHVLQLLSIARNIELYRV